MVLELKKYIGRQIRYVILKLINNYSEKVKIFDGSYLWVDPRDYIGATIFFFRDFDKSISKLLSDLLKKGDVFVDVGASCGIESIPCAKIVGQKGKVFSFEPHEISYNLLSKSLLENKLNNVVTMPFAVCSNNETKSLSVQPDNYGLSSILDYGEGHIPIYRLTDLSRKKISSSSADYIFLKY